MVGAIGIMPRIAAAAVSRIGRNRCVVASTTASQGWRPFAPQPWRVPPIFVLGGAADRFVPPDEVWRTATYYGVEPVIVPRLAHAVMREPRWEVAARALLTWLTTLPGQD